MNSTKFMPLISVIIVVYNAVNTIQSAIISVLTQNGNFELIVVDGNSNDGTTAIIDKHVDHISWFIREPDKGIYDAMNKGINVATGKWIYFLGADDRLAPGIIENIEPILSNTEVALICGSVLYEDGKKFISNLCLKTYLQNTVHHQAAFYNSNIFIDFRYDTKLRIIADYELNLVIYTKSLSYKIINHVIAICAKGGSSFDVDLSCNETNKIRGKFIKGYMNTLLSNILSIKYYIHYVLLRKI
jgi:putative colanic acid biosynthesis glycosyltransferase